MRLLNKIGIFAATLCATFSAGAVEKAVEWTANVEQVSATEGKIVLDAKVKSGYHFYSFAPEGGSTALEITAEGTNGFTAAKPEASLVPTTRYEENMECELSWWDKDVTITVPFTIDNAEGADIKVALRYQACDEHACLTPTTEKFTLAYGKEAATDDAAAASVDNATKLNPWWDSVETKAPTSDQTPWAILLLGFLGGLAALLTPCVWPMIPMTLSFFLKKGKSTSKSKRDAITYGLSIIVIYLILGLAITMIFGASKLNELSTNAIFNIFFFLLLVVFAISFFGAFDIKLPSKWSNAIDSKAETTSGVLSIFLMAFTLVLVSFSCTGPIIGTLLVEAAAQGNIVGPALGMGGFALGLAIPFSIFAFFPSMLKEMPKSGGWLNTVKVVLGFIELILSLKFLSVADMAYGWRLLDREVFVAIWIVLFVLLGLYLLGKIRFSHDSEQGHVSVTRFFLATISLTFAVYLMPGLWGAPLKAVSAFVPPLETQDFNLYSHNEAYVEFDDYDAAMQYAADNNMPVLMDFSGYGCVNCRNMEAEVFDTEQVRHYLTENFVVVKLMVDDRTPLSSPITVDNDGKALALETVGEKWSYLQMHKFGANSQPYYIVLDNEGRPMNDPVYYDNNIDSFMNWLETGLDNYKNQK